MKNRHVDVLMSDFSNMIFDARIYKEAKTLVDAGLCVQVVGFTKQKQSKDEYVREGVHYIDYPVIFGLGWIVRKSSLLLNAFRIWWHILRTNAAVYHAHNVFVLPPSFLAAKVLRKRILIYDSHELWSQLTCDHNFLLRFYVGLVEKPIIKRADAVITVNPYLADRIKQCFSPKRVLFTLNCPLYRGDGFNELRTTIRDSLGYESDDVIVLYQGGFYKEGRGLLELVEAFRYIGNAKLLLIGFDSEGMLAKIRDIVDHLHLEDRVSIHPPVDLKDLWQYTLAADIGFLGISSASWSNVHGSPNKLFEYLHAGLAIVHSDIPFVSDVLRSQHSGMKCLTPKSIASAIQLFLDDANRMERAKTSSLALAREFNWQNESRKLLGLYSVLVMEKAGRNFRFPSLGM